MRTLLLIAALVAAALANGCRESGNEIEVPEGPTAAATVTASIEAKSEVKATATKGPITIAMETRRAGRMATATEAASKPPTPRPTRTPKPPPYKLALISASCVHSYGYMECEGFVKNISGKTLEGIKVVVIWYDEGGVPQSSDSSYIDYSPILPGQESPWDTMGRYNPALTLFRVEFQESLGGTILTRDDRPH